MSEVLKGKTVEEARELFAHFHARVTGGEESPLAEPLAEEMERLEPLTGSRPIRRGSNARPCPGTRSKPP